VPASRPSGRFVVSGATISVSDGLGEILQRLGAADLGRYALTTKPNRLLPQILEFGICERPRLVQGSAVTMVAWVEYPICDQLFQSQTITWHRGKAAQKSEDSSG
jgi:hypothetical protein